MLHSGYNQAALCSGMPLDTSSTSGVFSLNVQDADGASCLHLASANSQRVIVAYLVSLGAALNDKTAAGLTPLMVAIAHADAPLADVLLRAGASVAPVDSEQRTVLHYAVLYAMPIQLIEDILIRDADIDAKDEVSLHVCSPPRLTDFRTGQGGLNAVSAGIYAHHSRKEYMQQVKEVVNAAREKRQAKRAAEDL
eukprot:m.102606 g.102606  ORF g.102606 m.102606 type:complete len:195 (+) comp51541_c0_seq6:208-792(+)